MTDRIIDLYTHFMPPGYLEKFQVLSKDPGVTKRLASIPMLYDLEARRRLVGQWPGYQQVLTPSPPGPEKLGDAKDRPGLARFINEGLAELVRKYPEEFPAFVAAISLDDIEMAIAELTYAVEELGARGVQIYTNVAGKPLDGCTTGGARSLSRYLPHFPPVGCPPGCIPRGAPGSLIMKPRMARGMKSGR